MPHAASESSATAGAYHREVEKAADGYAFLCIMHQARLAELRKTEVTVEESGLCPEGRGTTATRSQKEGEYAPPTPKGWPDASEPDGCEARRASGHWQPWVG